jgi:hypothetical protein
VEEKLREGRSSCFERWCAARPILLRVLCSGAALMATRVGLGVVGFRGWKQKLEELSRGDEGCSRVIDEAVLMEARQVARVMGMAERHLFFQPTCLERSLALWWMLRRRGIDAELRIGARKDRANFEAHAWLELNGTILNDESEEYRDFKTFEGLIGKLGGQAS